MNNRFQVASVVQGYGAVAEDRLAIQPFDGGVLLVIADGAGGSGAGREAADAVIGHVGQSLNQVPDPTDPTVWAGRLARADELLFKDGSGGETTAVVAVLTEHGVTGASVGDSGAWIITADDHWDLTRLQRRKPLIGSGTALPIAFTARCDQGTLLLATDGLLKYARASRICATVLTSPFLEAPCRLIELVRLPSGGLQDDVGLILARWD